MIRKLLAAIAVVAVCLTIAIIVVRRTLRPAELDFLAPDIVELHTSYMRADSMNWSGGSALPGPYLAVYTIVADRRPAREIISDIKRKFPTSQGWNHRESTISDGSIVLSTDMGSVPMAGSAPKYGLLYLTATEMRAGSVFYKVPPGSTRIEAVRELSPSEVRLVGLLHPGTNPFPRGNP